MFVKNSDQTGGWSMIKNPNVVLEHIGRDEYRLDESKVWPYFT